MKNKIVILLTLVSVLFSALDVRSADPLTLSLPKVLLPSGEPDPGLVISPLKRGNRAPFSGVHLAPASVATIIADYKFATEQINIEVERARSEILAQYEFEKKRLKIEFDTDKSLLQRSLDESNAETDRISKLLKKEIESRPNVPFWVGIGFAGGAGIVLLSIFAIGR